MSTAFGRSPRPGGTLAAALVALAALSMAGCGGSDGSGGFLGIQFPSASQDKENKQELRRRRQLEVFDRTVRNPSPDIDPEIRRQAAEELIAMDMPEATERLAGALGTGHPMVELAVIGAIINPFGIDLVLHNLLFASHGNLQDVTEWDPLVVASPMGFGFLVSWAALAVVIRGKKVDLSNRQTALFSRYRKMPGR